MCGSEDTKRGGAMNVEASWCERGVRDRVVTETG
jgi:hypothetical protein